MTTYAEALAGTAVTQFDMGASSTDARNELFRVWGATFGAQPGLFAAAAIAMNSFPRPPAESVEETAQLDPIRKAVGAQTPSEALRSIAAARDLLERMALEFG